MRKERYLRAIGVFTWLFAGSTSFVRFVRPWTVTFIAFGVAFFIGSDRAASRDRRIASLAVQALLAIALAKLGMPHFEGALLALRQEPSFEPS